MARCVPNLHCKVQERKPKADTNSSFCVLHPSSGVHTVRTVGSHLLGGSIQFFGRARNRYVWRERASISILMTSPGSKTHIARVADGEFFFSIGKAFSFSSSQEKIIKFNTNINVIHIKNENCKFLQNLYRKKKSTNTVQKSGRPSISIRSCHSNNIWVLKESSKCSLTLQVSVIDPLPSAM